MNNNTNIETVNTPMQGAISLMTALWGKNGIHQITTIKDGKTKNISVKNIEDAANLASELSSKGYDVYLACAEYGTGESRKGENATGAKGFWLDIDCGKDKAANDRGYTSQSDALQALKKFLMEASLEAPSHVVNSGNGLHVYFCLDTHIPKLAWRQTANKLKQLYHHHKFYADDTRTTDIASILRMPDTSNLKDASNPKPVILLRDKNPLIAEDFINSINFAHSKIQPESNNVIPINADLFNVEKLGTRQKYELFEETPENREKVLQASRAANNEGLPDRKSFMDLGLPLAELVVVHGWGEQTAKDILWDVASKPEGANQENNETEWQNYLRGTKDRHASGEPILSHRSIFDKAIQNGWKPKPSVVAEGGEQFALIRVGAQVGIVEIEQAKTASTLSPLSICNRDSGALLLKRQFIASNPKSDAGKAYRDWEMSPSTTTFSGVEMNPAVTTKGYLNLWRGLAVTPTEGEYALIKNFLLEVICDNNETLYNYVWNWLAHLVQKPQEKPGVSLTLLGGQGVGKGTFASKIVGALYSHHFLHLQTDKALTGDFNESLESSFVIFADEAFFSGDRKAANALKAIETESRIHVNPKYQPSRQIISYHRIIAASNNDHAAYVETDDRRKVVLRVSEKYKKNWDYWEALDHEIKNGGLEAFAYALQQTDISSFQVRDKPNTNELLKQKLASLDAISQWWADKLMMGAQLSSDANWSEWVSTQNLYTDFSDTVRANYSRARLLSTREFVEKIKTLCPDISPDQRGSANSRKRGFIFPSLEIARASFEAKLGGTVSWG